MYNNTQEDWDIMRWGVNSPETLYVGWIRPNGAPVTLTCSTDPHPPMSEERLIAVWFSRADSRAEAEQRWKERNHGAVVPLQHRVMEQESEVE